MKKKVTSPPARQTLNKRFTSKSAKYSDGMDVPKALKASASLHNILETKAWTGSKAAISIVLGKDVYGTPIIADLAELPHLLIAGTRGSGKSTCVHSLIASLLVGFSSSQLRFLMIDTTVTDLQRYEALPHLITPVISQPNLALRSLGWIICEIEQRLNIFAKTGLQNIKQFNECQADGLLPMQRKQQSSFCRDGLAAEIDTTLLAPLKPKVSIPKKLSPIVVIIAELAGLMHVAPAETESAIARITQMGATAGVHCVIATQRSSPDTITGCIKASIPARIAFHVTSQADSRTILDAMGAETLLGKGDLLYLPPGTPKLIHGQGAFISDEDLSKVIDAIVAKKPGQTHYSHA